MAPVTFRDSCVPPLLSRVLFNYFLILISVYTCSAFDNNAATTADSCSHSLAQCLSSSKSLQLLDNNIPSTSQEVKEACDQFTDGMKCMTQYLSECANRDVQTLMESQTGAAKRFFQHLCNSTKFRENYLHHTTCIRDIRKDWNECIHRYRSIIHQEISAPSSPPSSSPEQPQTPVTKFLHYCCSHRAYEKCVLNSAKFKCPPESMLFIQDILAKESPANCDSWDSRHKLNACNNAIGFNFYVNHLMLNFILAAGFVVQQKRL